MDRKALDNQRAIIIEAGPNDAALPKHLQGSPLPPDEYVSIQKALPMMDSSLWLLVIGVGSV